MTTRFDGHTPGPWSSDDGNIFGGDNPNDTRPKEFVKEHPYCIATVNVMAEMEPPSEQMRVNEDIIAAAPDLLRVGQELAEALEAKHNYNPCLGNCPRCLRLQEALAAWRKLTEAT